MRNSIDRFAAPLRMWQRFEAARHHTLMAATALIYPRFAHAALDCSGLWQKVRVTRALKAGRPSDGGFDWLWSKTVATIGGRASPFLATNEPSVVEWADGSSRGDVPATVSRDG
jgi:hypothetical protein